MTRLSCFYTIAIGMDFDKNYPPYFEAQYKEFKAKIAIDSGKAIEGALGKYSGEMVEEWRQLHEQELMENWQLSEQKKPLKPIAPLE